MTLDERDPSFTGPDLLDALANARQEMSPKMRAVAQFALSEPQRFARMTSREICAELNLSEPTLIRFCRGFGHAGLAEFRIELALALAEKGVGLVPSSADRRTRNPGGKAKIARAAIDLVRGDRSLLIDNGTTAEAFAGELGALEPLVVMTDGLNVAQRAIETGRHRVMLTGGDIQPQTASLTGRLVEHSLQDMRFDTFIMGADSIDPDCGFCTYSESEAHITRAMIGAAARVIVLIDHCKFGHRGLHRICDLSRAALVVVDEPMPKAMAEAMEAKGLRVVVAET